jgi:hypothetical protein
MHQRSQQKNSRFGVETLSQQELAEAYADMLKPYPWSHVSTHTFRRDTRVDAAMRHFRGYIERLEDCSPSPVGWFVTAEATHAGATHLHALLAVKYLSIRDLQRCWWGGVSHVRRYQRNRGFVHYMTKQIGGPVLDYDLGGLTALGAGQRK